MMLIKFVFWFIEKTNHFVFEHPYFANSVHSRGDVNQLFCAFSNLLCLCSLLCWLKQPHGPVWGERPTWEKYLGWIWWTALTIVFMLGLVQIEESSQNLLWEFQEKDSILLLVLIPFDLALENCWNFIRGIKEKKIGVGVREQPGIMAD